MPETIADTSFIQYLFQINHFDLLHLLYGQIIIPRAVYAEIKRGVEIGVALPNISSASWVEIQNVVFSPEISFPKELGIGEREVLALSLQIPNSLAIIDDALARKQALILNVRVTGTLGILLKAKRSGLIPAIKPLLEELHNKRFFLKTKTKDSILRMAGEL